MMEMERRHVAEIAAIGVGYEQDTAATEAMEEVELVGRRLLLCGCAGSGHVVHSSCYKPAPQTEQRLFEQDGTQRTRSGHVRR